MAGKSDVTRAIAAQSDLTQDQVSEVLDLLPGVIRDLAIGDERRTVNLPNFLKVELQWKEARTARNPRTGEPVEVAERWNLVSKSARSYQDSVEVNSDDE